VVFLRTPQLARFQVLRVSLRGAEEALWTREAALGVFPVGFEPSGPLIAVVIDGRGSTVTRDGKDILSLGPTITRDWQLSPDGAQLAYVEANVENGLRYLARSASLSGGASVQAQSLSADVTALGVAWEPRTGRPTFGVEPGQELGSVTAQALKADAGGFDVPLAYAPDGSSLAVMRWSGESFREPGTPKLELVDASGRTGIDEYTRFLGWARR